MSPASHIEVPRLSSRGLPSLATSTRSGVRCCQLAQSTRRAWCSDAAVPASAARDRCGNCGALIGDTDCEEERAVEQRSRRLQTHSAAQRQRQRCSAFGQQSDPSPGGCGGAATFIAKDPCLGWPFCDDGHSSCRYLLCLRDPFGSAMPYEGRAICGQVVLPQRTARSS